MNYNCKNISLIFKYKIFIFELFFLLVPFFSNAQFFVQKGTEFVIYENSISISIDSIIPQNQNLTNYKLLYIVNNYTIYNSDKIHIIHQNKDIDFQNDLNFAKTSKTQTSFTNNNALTVKNNKTEATHIANVLLSHKFLLTRGKNNTDASVVPTSNVFKNNKLISLKMVFFQNFKTFKTSLYTHHILYVKFLLDGNHFGRPPPQKNSVV